MRDILRCAYRSGNTRAGRRRRCSRGARGFTAGPGHAEELRPKGTERRPSTRFKYARECADEPLQQPASQPQEAEVRWRRIRTVGDATRQKNWKRVVLTEPETNAQEAATPEEPAQGSTFISSGAHFEGTLTLRGDFRIDSEFQGAVRTDGKVVVGESGSVVGDIEANAVELLGAVQGDISARRELILRAGSRLHGEITTACLEIERHAFFRGTTAMTEPQNTSRAHSRETHAAADSTGTRKAAGFASPPPAPNG